MPNPHAPYTGVHGLETERVEPAYDYIVVGAGTAGSVIAARLSEDESKRVLLIEAGSATALPEMDTPGIWPVLLATPANWGESTVTQSFLGHPLPAPRRAARTSAHRGRHRRRGAQPTRCAAPVAPGGSRPRGPPDRRR